MKTLDKIAYGFSLLLIVILSACMPTVVQDGTSYKVSNTNGDITIIGASEDILSWEPVEACKYQETIQGEQRAIVCPVPTEVVVLVAVDKDGNPAEITVTPANSFGIPVGVPK